MGIRRALRLIEQAGGPYPNSEAVPRPQIASPWTDRSTLETIVWADLFGLDCVPATRAEALSVPALHRAVTILTTSCARSPLGVYRLAERVDPQPSWTQRTDGLSSPFHRMLLTVDDLVFHGESLWAVERGADGFPTRAERVPYDAWSVDQSRQILIGDEVVDARAVVYIPGPHEGILTHGDRTIRSAASVERAALEAAQRPFRLELHQTSDTILEDVEVDALITTARTALAEHGGVLFTNSTLQAILHPAAPEQLLVQGRNAAAVDLARLVGIPAALVDATTAGASLTYETTAGRNQEFLDYGLVGYLAAVSSRLSMDDVVPRGQRTAFELEDLIGPAPAATGPATED